jgi:large subunit ribosomal protein L11
VEKGSAQALHQNAGKVTSAAIREIAETKMKDLNASSVEAAMRIIAGSARSMGIEVVE